MTAGSFAPFRVTAPSSTANLGPGFDAFAIALGIRNELIVTAGSGVVTIEGEGADSLACDHSNLVAASFARVAPGVLSSVDLRCMNRIPLARGMGSSTAAAATGLVAGWEAAGVAWHASQLHRELTVIDGHGDNAAACAFGGCVLSTTDEVAVRIGNAMGDAIAFVLAIPPRPLSTVEARAVLPTEYPREDVSRAIGFSGLLGVALATSDTHALSRALAGDVIHERYRGRLVPELGVIRQACAGSVGVIGITLSGAGPTVAVWCDPAVRDEVRNMITECVPECSVIAPDIDPLGVVVSPVTAGGISSD